VRHDADLPPRTTVVGTPAASRTDASGNTGAVDARRAQSAGVDKLPYLQKGPTTFWGEWRLKPEVLANRYGGLPDAEHWGIMTVALPGGKSVEIRDNQFLGANGDVGVRLIPVGDKNNGQFQGVGATIVDPYLRQQMGVGPADPNNIHKGRIYAQGAFWHPELFNAADLKACASDNLGTEMRQTHRTAYTGDGDTLNSPEGYHMNVWEVEGGGTGYPCHVYMESLKGVDQETYNWQGIMVHKALNKGVVFPGDYKNAPFRAIDLNTALTMFRDWILGADYLRQDRPWETYCAAHAELASAIRRNVPMNKDSFVEIFGADAKNGGAALWDAYTKQGGWFETTMGTGWDAKYETHFEPLWKMQGLTADQIRPWKDYAAWKAYEDAHIGGPDTMKAYQAAGNFMPIQEEGKGLGYRYEATSDLLTDFLQTYASFQEAGGVVMATMLMGFKDQMLQRLGIDDANGNATFMKFMQPTMVTLLNYEAQAVKAEGQIPLAMWAKGAQKAMTDAFGAAGAPLVAALFDPTKGGVDVQKIDAGPGIERAKAEQMMMTDLDGIREQARMITPGNEDVAVERTAPPALITRLGQGLRDYDPLISIRYLCTVVHDGDLQKVG
jgi:hypothetical protein